MAETLLLPETKDRAEIYAALMPQIEGLMAAETDLVANMANFAAALKEAFGFFWVGFYVFKETELVLGPFQGPIACTRIKPSRGVCGHAFSTASTVLVPNVEEFPGHIACSSASKSEIVVPIFGSDQKVVAVLDVDSDQLNDFSATDGHWLEKMVKSLSNHWD